MVGGDQPIWWSDSYGSEGAPAGGFGSVRVSVAAAMSSTGVRAPKLAYHAGRSGSAAW